MLIKRKELSAAVRIRVYKRDRFQCTYCGVPGTDAELEIDHVIPVARGGSNHMSNLTTACRGCNQEKSDKTAPTPKVRAPASEPETPRQPSSMVGLYLHTFKNGRICYQGKIVDVAGPVALVQLYSWMWGDPTNIEAIALDVICSDKVRLYSSHDAWLEAAEKDGQRDRTPRGDRSVIAERGGA